MGEIGRTTRRTRAHLGPRDDRGLVVVGEEEGRKDVVDGCT